MAFSTLVPSQRFAPRQAGFVLAGLVQATLQATLLANSFMVNTANAAEFSSEDGRLTGALDTTLSYGAMWRVQSPDGTQYRGNSEPNHDDVNTNDGNRAFDTGLVSQVFKISADLELSWEDRYGLFVRGTAFYDTVLMDTHNNWGDANQSSVDAGFPGQYETYPYGNDWADDVLEGQGRDASIQDAYVFGSWDIGEMPLDVRFGKQVMNWGEGIFYRDGINSINALDGANFGLPGSEIKDLLIPQHALSFNLGLTENLSMSAYYQFQWEESVLPGRGTYFSNNDLFADGSTKGYDEIDPGLARLNDAWAAVNGEDLYTAAGIDTDSGYLVVADTSGKVDADDGGQWGFNFKYYAGELNDTEFGFYFVNYNSHLPYIEAQVKGGGILRAQALTQDPAFLQQAQATASTLVQAGGLQPGDPGYAEAVGATTQEIVGTGAGVYLISNEVEAYRVYPEDIQMYGVSFNTAIGSTSIAGELAYRPNAPMWLNHPDDLIDGLSDNLGNLLLGQECITGLSEVYPGQQYCVNGAPYQNYEEVKLWTGSLVFIHNFGPGLGFDGLYGILEPAFEYVQGLDEEYDYYTSTAAGPYGDGFDDKYHPGRDRLDKFSWGYTAVLSGEWNNVLAGVNLNPVLTYRHDVQGNSRATGNFLAGSKATTVAINAVYNNSLEASLAYTAFFGAERTNKMHDRDNVAFSIKYLF